MFLLYLAAHHHTWEVEQYVRITWQFSLMHTETHTHTCAHTHTQTLQTNLYNTVHRKIYIIQHNFSILSNFHSPYKK